ncbi:tyrosine-type recombinase/integrase [Geodermatophilus bullaregiensis]|uniref:tyrosine-type recombinase/integrase n=1 Tax=Geodermatophilus bullaregiensis TaxID=1564160 RepID=UPI0027DE0A76|nr:tyrosine-type recombinase/integrase [Geodermatophilus bullaregiensis]
MSRSTTSRAVGGVRPLLGRARLHRGGRGPAAHPGRCGRPSGRPRAARSERYRALVTLAAGTGLRQGEALGLTVDRIDFLSGVTFHWLRHCYASLLIRHGESVKTVQARLGHASASETLDTYSHLWSDSDDRTRAAVDAVLAPAAERRLTAVCLLVGGRSLRRRRWCALSARSAGDQHAPWAHIAAGHASHCGQPTGTSAHQRASPGQHLTINAHTAVRDGDPRRT